MDIGNLRLESGHTVIVTAKTLDESGCPFCHNVGNSDSTLAFLRGELPEDLQSCGNVYVFVCHGCHKRAIGVQNMPSADQSEALRILVAQKYGGVSDDRLIVVSMARNIHSDSGKIAATT